MKRTRLRRKSKTPPPWEDREARMAYLNSHPRDELERWLRGDTWRAVEASDWRMGLDPHHILHTGGVRWDVPQNLLTITRRAHDYLHFKEPIATVAVLYAKLHDKTRSARARIRSVLKAKYFDPIGWAQARRDAGDVPLHYEECVQALLELF